MRSSRLWSHKNKYNLKKEQEPFKTNQEYTKLDVTPMIFFSFVSCYLKFRLSQIQINIVYICVGSLLLDPSLLMDIKTGYIYIYIYTLTVQTSLDFSVFLSQLKMLTLKYNFYDCKHYHYSWHLHQPALYESQLLEQIWF